MPHFYLPYGLNMLEQGWASVCETTNTLRRLGGSVIRGPERGEML